ncbi:hypothetical protein [Microbacterium sp. NPDC058389]|uniref:hypothetical protein n=1 Tax=Microbacterium sp. NPDC058389 TaxID=3346475 RepID=UPI00365E1242
MREWRYSEFDHRFDEADEDVIAARETRQRRARAAWRGVLRALGVLLGAGILGVTLTLTAWAVLIAVFAPDPGYVEPTTARQWLVVIDRATRELLQTSAALAMTLLATCLIAMTGAARGRTGWTLLGVVCSVLLAVGLVGTAVAGGQVGALAARAVSEVGGTPAVAAPRPTPPPPPPPVAVDDAREEMIRMLQATVDAAVAPVTNDDGTPLVVADTLLEASACNEGGSRLTASLSFSTGDNATSLASLLGAWDEAGYLPDRAMQEDIRYSTTLPIERMGVRDRTSTDGLIHLSIVGACATAVE